MYCADHTPLGVLFNAECDALLPFVLLPPDTREQRAFVMREVREFVESMGAQARNRAEQMRNEMITIVKDVVRNARIKQILVSTAQDHRVVVRRKGMEKNRRSTGELHRTITELSQRVIEINSKTEKRKRERKTKEVEDDDYEAKKKGEKSSRS